MLALPELCLTGYTCGDLFLQDTLLRGAEEGLQTILEATRNLEIVTALGLPVWDKWDNKLYNCAAIIQKGEMGSFMSCGGLHPVVAWSTGLSCAGSM